ncbi:MAG: cell division protein SepF [bacterium]
MFNINRLWLGPKSDSLDDGFDSLFAVKDSQIPAPSREVEAKLKELDRKSSESGSMDVIFGSKNTNTNHLEAVTTKSKSMNILVIEPRSFEDSMEIVKNLKSRNTVIVNLQYLDNESSQRVIDFVSGAAVAMDGSYERVGSGVFIFAPINCNLKSNSGSDVYNEIFNKAFSQQS